MNTAEKNTHGDFFKDLKRLFSLKRSSRYSKICVEEFPFDGELLTLSPLYRKSRTDYLSIEGVFKPSLLSTMRALSTQDLFKNQISFTPSRSEIEWFYKNWRETTYSDLEVEALIHFNDNSLFHEQNHRIVWQLLPPAPSEEFDLCRYLNFAESLVVTLDMALGDELGSVVSPVFERMRVIYRSGGKNQWFEESKSMYRSYLLSCLCSTYFLLELMRPEDILNSVNYIFPNTKKLNKAAVKRSLELNEFFTRVTNPQWQEQNWRSARLKLKNLKKGSGEDPLYIPSDPLDLEEEFVIANAVLSHFGL